MIESSKRDKTYVLIFDNFNERRQFQGYDLEKFVNFVKNTVAVNGGKIEEINVFTKSEEKKYNAWYQRVMPDVVYLQTVATKGQAWSPSFGNSKLVLFAWHMDSTSDLSKFGKKISLNVARHQRELIFYGNKVPDWMGLSEKQKAKIDQVKTKFYGNIRKASLCHVPYEGTQGLLNSLKHKRVCFIAEAHIRSGEKKYFEQRTGDCVDFLLKSLKERGFHTVWKKREKGYPKKDFSPLEFCKLSPDLQIDKDLNYPSSLFTVANASQLNIVVNTSACIFDLKDINKNTIMVLTTDSSERERKYLDRWYSGEGLNVYDFTKEVDRERFLVLLSKLEQHQEKYSNDQTHLHMGSIYEAIDFDIVK